MSEILVVGSVAYDTIYTPQGAAPNILGGSANYFAVAAANYSKVNVVGVVGQDYRTSDLNLLKSRNVDLSGLKQVEGKTFHWEGRYNRDMNEPVTLETQLNVFANFNPELPEKFRSSEYIFLANIDPELQMKVLDQVKSPRIVGVDTMNYWIDSKREALLKILQKSDVFLLNEGEARRLSGDWNTISAVKTLAALGPRAVVVKRGEYGFVLYSEGQYFILPAYPVSGVVDPTGAGDTFAGGFFGYLSKMNYKGSFAELKEACIHGCILASFTVEGFGLSSIAEVDWAKVEKRHQDYRKVVSYLS